MLKIELEMRVDGIDRPKIIDGCTDINICEKTNKQIRNWLQSTLIQKIRFRSSLTKFRLNELMRGF